MIFIRISCQSKTRCFTAVCYVYSASAEEWNETKRTNGPSEKRTDSKDSLRGSFQQISGKAPQVSWLHFFGMELNKAIASDTKRMFSIHITVKIEK